MKAMTKILFLIVMLATSLAVNSHAQKVLLGAGARVGVTSDPEQVHFGAHFNLGEIADRVRFQPNVEVGIGDDVTLVAINPEAMFLFTTESLWVPYAGGGIGLNFYNWDSKSGLPSGGDSDFEVGLNLLAGLERQLSPGLDCFFEMKFGVGDSPDVKLTTGLTWGL